MISKIVSKKIKNNIEGHVFFTIKKVEYCAYFSIMTDKYKNTVSVKKIMQWNGKLQNYADKVDHTAKIYPELKKYISSALLNSKKLMGTMSDEEKTQESKKLFDDKIVMIDPKLIIPNPYQKDYYSEGGANREKRRQLMASIKKYGIKNPIQLTTDYVLIAGKRRTGIALELLLPKVPCQIAKYKLTDDELKLHMLEDNYLNRDVGSQQRRKIYADMVDLIKKQIPNFEFLIRENKPGLQKEVEAMGFSAKTSEKVLGQARRIAVKKDNERKSGIIQTDYMSMIKSVNNLATVYADTNQETRDKIKPVIIEKLRESGLVK